MDFESPIRSVIPSAHGAVLTVLARAGKPLTGRAIALLTGGAVGVTRTSQVLSQMTDAGVVTREPHGPINLYQLNLDHVAAPAVLMLARLRDELMERMQKEVARWEFTAVSVWLFGSAARGEASERSDLDVLVVRPDAVDEADPVWLRQLEEFTARTKVWSGNDVQILELSKGEVRDWVSREEPLVESLRAHALTITGETPGSLLRRKKVPS